MHQAQLALFAFIALYWLFKYQWHGMVCVQCGGRNKHEKDCPENR